MKLEINIYVYIEPVAEVLAYELVKLHNLYIS